MPQYLPSPDPESLIVDENYIQLDNFDETQTLIKCKIAIMICVIIISAIFILLATYGKH